MRFDLLSVLFGIFAVFISSATSLGLQLTQTSDSSVIVGGTVYRNPSWTDSEIGFWGNTPLASVYVFQLPPRPAGQVVLDASFLVQAWQRTYPQASITFDADLYGLRASTSPTVTAADLFAGPFGGDPAATTIEAEFLTPAISANYVVPTAVTSTNTADLFLTQYLNSAYVQVGAGGYVFFRLNPNVSTFAQPSYYSAGYEGPFYEEFVDFKETHPYATILTLQFTPEPGSDMTLTGIALAALLHRRKNIIPDYLSNARK